MTHIAGVGAGPMHPWWGTLVDDGPFYVAVCDTAGRLIYVNRPVGLGLSSDLVGRHASELFPRGDGPDLLEMLGRIAGGGGPELVELPARLSDRRTVRLELSLLPVRDERVTSAILMVGRDVTDATRTALELRMSVNALHRTIESREQLEADLHDGILQSLYGVGMRVEAARGALAAGGADAGLHLERAIEQLKSIMSEIRSYIREGAGTLPATERWDETLSGVLRGLEVAGGPAIVLELEPKAVARVAGSAQSAVVFIAREAVSNAVRHAGAARIAVRLHGGDAQVRLEVEDDGVGMPRERPPEGFGLLTMGRRASQIGATVTIQNLHPRGTLVRVDLPATGMAARHD